MSRSPSKREVAIYLEQSLSLPPKRAQTGISLTFPYDLRTSLDEKRYDASVFHLWTAFVNNTGTLCHVVSPESGILIRLKFAYPLKCLSHEQMLGHIISRIYHYIKL